MRKDPAIWSRRTLIFIIAVSAIRLALLPALDLTPQDAYYWQYSEHPAMGYFDHPPVHAWSCWLTTTIFGDNPFGIRFGPWLYGLGILVMLYLMARRLYGEEAGFWVAAAAGVTPLFTIGSSVLTPDPPLLFFWLISMFTGYLALDEDRPALWLAAGFAGGLAMLSKYTAAFLAPGFLIALLFTRNGRKHLISPWPWLGLLLGVVAFSPQIIWNARHDWASFAFQTTRRAGEISRWRLDLFGGMLGSQLAVVSPLLFGGIIWALFRGGWRRLFAKKSGLADLYLPAMALPTILFFGFISLRYWVKMNWMAPGYLAGIIALIGATVAIGRGRGFLKWALGLAALETVALYALVLTPAVPLTGEAVYFEGWQEAAARVDEIRDDMDNPFVAGWGYKVPSELRFYLDERPETHCNEIFGGNGLNYNYWTDTDLLLGRDCIFVADSREPFRHPELLKEHFARVSGPEVLKPTRGGKPVTEFRIWRCFEYLGP